MVDRFDRDELHTAGVLDILGGLGYVHGPRLHTRTGQQETIVAPAQTVWCRPGDNLGIWEALKDITPGAALVVAGSSGGQAALVGDYVYGLAVEAGAGAIVLDGHIRDSWVVTDGPIPVYCLGVIPRPPTKVGAYRLGVPIAVGGVAVLPGDVIVADADGVVVVPQLEAESCLEKARASIADEAAGNFAE